MYLAITLLSSILPIRGAAYDFQNIQVNDMERSSQHSILFVLKSLQIMTVGETSNAQTS